MKALQWLLALVICANTILRVFAGVTLPPGGSSFTTTYSGAGSLAVGSAANVQNIGNSKPQRFKTHQVTAEQTQAGTFQSRSPGALEVETRDTAKATNQPAPDAVLSRMHLLGTFQIDWQPTVAVAGDFNGDGLPDLVLADQQTSEISIVLSDGKGAFGKPERFAIGNGPRSLTVGDFNRDGHFDVAVANEWDGTVSILLGDGQGHLNHSAAFQVGLAPIAIVTGDFNLDGCLDLAVANEGSRNISILFSNCKNNFRENQLIGLPGEPIGLRIADIRYEGRLSLLVATRQENGLAVYKSDAEGAFQKWCEVPLREPPVALEVGDLRHKGIQDAIVATRTRVLLLDALSEGSTLRYSHLDEFLIQGVQSLGVGDIDGDGTLDILTLSDTGVTVNLQTIEHLFPDPVVSPGSIVFIGSGGEASMMILSRALDNMDAIVFQSPRLLDEPTKSAVPALLKTQPSSTSSAILQPGAQVFQWPVTSPLNPSNDFATWNAISNYMFHTGVDLCPASPSGCPVGPSVYAAADGQVEAVFRPNNDTLNRCNNTTSSSYPISHGLGNAVVIAHPNRTATNRIYTLYGHLDCVSLGIDVGTLVFRGTTQLGNMGRSDYVRQGTVSPHVHFEVKNLGVVGSISNDYDGTTPTYWGYSPDIPLGYGYHDPREYIFPFASSPITPVPIRVVASPSLSVRSGPGSGVGCISTSCYAVVTQASFGQLFVAFAQSGSWYQVYLPNAFGPTSGWLAADSGGQTLAVIDNAATQVQVTGAGAGGLLIRPSANAATSLQVWDNTAGYTTCRNVKIWDGERFIQTASQTGWSQYYLPLNHSFISSSCGPTNTLGPSQGWSSESFLNIIPGFNALPTVTTTAVTNVTETTAFGGGTVTADGGATVTTRGVCWSTSVNPTTTNICTNNGSGTGAFTSSITGLTANTFYHVRAYATNSAGTAYGSDLTFTTQVAVSTPTVNTAAATSVTSGGATFNGTVNPNNGPTNYWFEYGTSSTLATFSSTTSQPAGSGSTGLNFNWTLSGLSASTTYYFRIVASNSAGTNRGSILSFTTQAAVSPPTVTTTAITNIGQTTATGGGTVAADGGGSVTARGVCWSTAANPTIANSCTSNGSGTGAFTSSISGLTANTFYHVRAYATNSAGTAYGSDLTFTTLASITVTVTTSPVGRSFSVDGTSYNTAQTFTWISGSSHTISTSSPQGTSTRYAFSGWSDGGAISHTVAPTSNTTYTANFNTQYQLTTVVSPIGAGTIAPSPNSGDGYYNANTSVQLAAVANGGYTFANWSGDLTGGTNPQSVTMTTPRSVTANFLSTTPQVLLNPTALSFPAQVIGIRSIPTPLRLSNVGGSTLMLNGFQLTGSWFSADWASCPSTLVSGSSCDIWVVFRPMGIGQGAGSLTIESNAPGSPHSIPLNGSGFDLTLSLTRPRRPSRVVLNQASAQTYSLSLDSPFAVKNVQLSCYVPSGYRCLVPAFAALRQGITTIEVSVVAARPKRLQPSTAYGVTLRIVATAGEYTKWIEIPLAPQP